jgi:hypothetical protein
MDNIEKLANELDWLKQTDTLNYNGILETIKRNIGSCEQCKEESNCKIKETSHNIKKQSYWFCANYERRN